MALYASIIQASKLRAVDSCAKKRAGRPTLCRKFETRRAAQDLTFTLCSVAECAQDPAWPADCVSRRPKRTITPSRVEALVFDIGGSVPSIRSPERQFLHQLAVADAISTPRGPLCDGFDLGGGRRDIDATSVQQLRPRGSHIRYASGLIVRDIGSSLSSTEL